MSTNGKEIAEETLRLLANRPRRYRDRVIALNAPLATNVSKIYKTKIPDSVATLEDLYQLCLIGISLAVDNDHKRRGSFSAFAKQYMLQEMARWRRSHWGGIPRLWVEVRDTVTSRAALYERLTAQPIDLEHVAVNSLGMNAEMWQEIFSAYQLGYGERELVSF